MSIDTASDDDDTVLERAAEQALDLRATVMDLSDPALSRLVDLVLMELGVKLARKTHNLQK